MDAFEAISLPESSSLQCRKRFSLAEANRAITLVRRVVADITREYARLRELHSTCGKLDSQGHAAKAEEVRRQYVSVSDRLSALREELDEIGCELKDYSSGLVDFPAKLKDRDVLLCWMPGEDRIAWWHDVDTGFNSRQPLGEEWAE